MEELLQGVREAVAGLPVSILVVFGSRARGRERADSDLDVAVLPSESGRSSRLGLRARLASALSHLAPEGRVDVVLLDEAPELLRCTSRARQSPTSPTTRPGPRFRRISVISRNSRPPWLDS